MPRVLLLLPSATYRAEAFLEAAQRLQLAVTLGLERGSVLLSRPPGHWLSLNFTEPERSTAAVVEYAQASRIDAVVGVDDGTAELAAHIANALGLPHNSPHAVAAARNKWIMRSRLREAGVPVPDFQRGSAFDDPTVLAQTVAYPCVLKPLRLSASCGVIRANDSREFVPAFQRIVTILSDLGLMKTGETGCQILIERFLPGREVSLEGLLTEGRLRVLALFDKPDPLDGPYFEETIYVTPSRLPALVQQDLAACAARAAAALGLHDGPIHGELRLNAEGIWVIEIAARSIGGRCSRTLRFASNMSLEELILRHALRMELPPLTRPDAAAGVMMLPIPRAGILQEVEGQDRAARVPGIEEVTMTTEIGQRLVPLPEGTRYLGFILARGDTPAQVEQALRAAHGHLTIRIDEEAHVRTGPFEA